MELNVFAVNPHQQNGLRECTRTRPALTKGNPERFPMADSDSTAHDSSPQLEAQQIARQSLLALYHIWLDVPDWATAAQEPNEEVHSNG